MAESKQLHDLQQNFMNYVLGESSDMVEKIESTPALSAKGRLDIYATAYKLRLKEAITTDYAKLHSYLGDEQFDAVMERYIDKYPSHITNLRYYSISMPILLREERPFNQMPVLAELATIEAAFSDIVLSEQLNSDIIEVNDSLAIVLRLNEYQEANVKPLAEVTTQIKDILVAQKASEKAQTVADELLASFQSGADITEQLAAIGATMEVKTAVVRVGSGLDASLAREAFKLPRPSEGAVSAATVNLSNGDLAVLEVQAVNVGEAKDSPNLTQQLTQQLAQAAYLSYVESLKTDAEIIRREVAAPTSQY